MWLLQCGVVLGILFLLILVAALRLFAFFTKGICRSTASMKGKTVIITGANSGIGKETARDLARRGAKVIMACRNLETAHKARDEIIKDTGNEEVIVKKLDLSSLKSVRDFADDINRTVTKVNVLVHNAGLAYMFDPKITEDGLELTMGTNHFGPFLLTHLLIGLLKQSTPSRIVIVASELYRLANLNLNNLNPVSGFPAYLYYVSKYANIVFAQELARRLEGTGVTVNSLHPGMIDSGIWRNVPFPLSLPLKIIIKGFFKSPEEGAQTTIYLSVSESVEGVSGKYFLDCKEYSLSHRAKDAATAKKLWELSETFVGLKPNDPHI
ncbi:retinol dehydrogenase 14 [Zootermopsis nevadensis]|uniref:Retinol dehydrogenase 14 n=1 Tax=Zootermopsis nevadensis TaxID=136037 RepID=A0A067RFS8_ZOONE|nr:retinol dehydrogenase 14 [Zootermopsis nevadensis]XP_021922922.1 retinol dehydrogenase 14 [Zootermopsis nevadensis]XP_021922923.1 retinol dehydrogenase 14 [Zootermopsis nevadensis]KDR17887.1 Retinol dehydrogenase 14 [Zootermopsis nevadensis]